MSGNVTPIRADLAPTLSEEPDPVIVQYLEELLAEARAGRIQGIIWVALHPGDLTSDARAGLITSAVIGKLEIAKARAIRIALEDQEMVG